MAGRSSLKWWVTVAQCALFLFVLIILTAPIVWLDNWNKRREVRIYTRWVTEIPADVELGMRRDGVMIWRKKEKP